MKGDINKMKFYQRRTPLYAEDDKGGQELPPPVKEEPKKEEPTKDLNIGEKLDKLIEMMTPKKQEKAVVVPVPPKPPEKPEEPEPKKKSVIDVLRKIW